MECAQPRREVRGRADNGGAARGSSNGGSRGGTEERRQAAEEESKLQQAIAAFAALLDPEDKSSAAAVACGVACPKAILSSVLSRHGDKGLLDDGLIAELWEVAESQHKAIAKKEVAKAAIRQQRAEEKAVRAAQAEHREYRLRQAAAAKALVEAQGAVDTAAAEAMQAQQLVTLRIELGRIRQGVASYNRNSQRMGRAMFGGLKKTKHGGGGGKGAIGGGGMAEKKVDDENALLVGVIGDEPETRRGGGALPWKFVYLSDASDSDEDERLLE